MATVTTPDIRIGMLGNAEHSLLRGYELLAEGLQEDEPWPIKEAILWVHHGIELCLKQLLVQRASKFLVFSNVDEAVRKLAHLRRQPGMEEADAVDMLERKEGPHTVGFDNLVKRVTTMLDVEELREEEPLRVEIDQLVNIRNRLAHSTAKVNIVEAGTLLTEMGMPFLEVIAREFGEPGFTYGFVMSFRQAVGNATIALESYEPEMSEAESRVLSLIHEFAGQQVPANLFGQVRQGQDKLPDFSDAEVSKEVGYKMYLVEGDEGAWLVSVIEGYGNKESMLIRKQWAARYEDAELWVVAMSGTYPYVYPDILVSTGKDIEILEKLLRGTADMALSNAVIDELLANQEDKAENTILKPRRNLTDGQQ